MTSKDNEQVGSRAELTLNIVPSMPQARRQRKPPCLLHCQSTVSWTNPRLQPELQPQFTNPAPATTAEDFQQQDQNRRQQAEHEASERFEQQVQRNDQVSDEPEDADVEG